MISVLFTRRRHPGSWLIRAATWSEWSHVDIIRHGGTVVGATAMHGVSFAAIDERLSMASAAAIVTFPVNEDGALLWADAQIGKPYDWAGVVGLGIHRDWEEESSWFCSEFVARAMKEGGYEPYRTESLNRMTPQDLWRLNMPMILIK